MRSLEVLGFGLPGSLSLSLVCSVISKSTYDTNLYVLSAGLSLIHFFSYLTLHALNSVKCHLCLSASRPGAECTPPSCHPSAVTRALIFHAFSSFEKYTKLILWRTLLIVMCNKSIHRKLICNAYANRLIIKGILQGKKAKHSLVWACPLRGFAAFLSCDIVN